MEGLLSRLDLVALEGHNKQSAENAVGSDCSTKTILNHKAPGMAAREGLGGRDQCPGGAGSAQQGCQQESAVQCNADGDLNGEGGVPGAGQEVDRTLIQSSSQDPLLGSVNDRGLDPGTSEIVEAEEDEKPDTAAEVRLQAQEGHGASGVAHSSGAGLDARSREEHQAKPRLRVLDWPLDLSDPSEQCLLAAALLAEGLQLRVRAQLGYTLSVGVAHNKLLAKMGSSMTKPFGITVVRLQSQ